jgi:hypothetical protein
MPDGGIRSTSGTEDPDMLRHFAFSLALGAGVCAAAAGQVATIGPMDAHGAAAPGLEVRAAWADLWDRPFGPEETWLLRAAPDGTGDESLIFNSEGMRGRLGVVYELPLSAMEGRTAAAQDLLGSLEARGFTNSAIGVIVETDLSCIALVALDVRDRSGSLLIPYAITTEEGLFDATEDLRRVLQRDDRGAFTAATQDCNALGLTCPQKCACKKANCIEESDVDLDGCEGDCWIGLGFTGTLAVATALAASTVTFGGSLLLVSGPVGTALLCFKNCDDDQKKALKKCHDGYADCMAACDDP